MAKKQDKRWRALVKDLHGKHAERMNDLLVGMSDKEFRIAYVKLLEYTQPKLQRKEVATTPSKGANVLQIQVINTPKEARALDNVIDITPDEA